MTLNPLALQAALAAVTEQHLKVVVETAIVAYIAGLPEGDRLKDCFELRNGRIRMDVTARRVYIDRRLVDFTKKEFELLRFFMLNKGRAIETRSILKEVWGPGYLECVQQLRVYCSDLRRKIEPDPKSPIYLVSERGVGYRMELVDAAESGNAEEDCAA